jgi:hypothetical protein
VLDDVIRQYDVEATRGEWQQFRSDLRKRERLGGCAAPILRVNAVHGILLGKVPANAAVATPDVEDTTIDDRAAHKVL